MKMRRRTRAQGWFEGQSTRFPKQPSRVSERSELPSEPLNERSVPGEWGDDGARPGERRV